MHPSERVLLVIPVLDDWPSVDTLCRALDAVFQTLPEYEASVLLVDDGSTTEPVLGSLARCRSIRSCQILHLKRNVGHQRAIAIGLAYSQEHLPSSFVVVMDGDGEDRPEHVPELLRALAGSPAQAVFAERRKRFESLMFRVCYAAYKMLHRIMTGRSIRYGNFSAIRFDALPRLTVMSELWTHYAAAVALSKLPFTTVRLDRGKRYTGATKMKLDSLVLHGLAAMALYPSVSIRVLVGSAFVGMLSGLVALVVIIVRVTTDLAIAGWTTTMIGFAVTLFSMTTMLSLIFVFINLALRSLSVYLPIRDYTHFVRNHEYLHDVQLSRE
jgi:glycosyltransferase involved in cell wall biosynthesis